MSRRSTRLLALDYYREDPKISYRETAVKVFRRRRRRAGPQVSARGPGASRALLLDSSYRSEDQNQSNGANDRPTEDRTLFYWQVTLILLLIFGLRLMMTSQTLSDSASEGFNTETEEFITQMLMEKRFQTKILQIEAEINNSLGILQRKQLHLEQGVVQLARASQVLNQQLWARLAHQGRSLNKMKVDLNTWIGGVTKTPSGPQGSVPTELQDMLDLWFQEKLGRRCGQPVADEMADFALESQGGRVLRHLCSPTYPPRASVLWSLSSCFRPRSPRWAIQGQPELLPGQCWAFAGGTGHMVISLSHPINISHVTLDHIASHKTPTGRIDSAPRNILVYGMADCEQNTEGTLLGNFVYDEEGEPSQTFTLHGDKGVFKLVKLLVRTNWGHPDFTCLYRFRVHGKIHSH